MPEPARKKCHAHRRDGNKCTQWAVDGWNVCRMHGAGGGRPIKHGRYSRVLKKSGLASHYDEAVEDRNLFDLKEPIALLEACLQRTTERVADRDTPDFRKRCLDLFEAAQQALKDGDSAGMSSNLKVLGQLLRDGVSEDRAIDQLSDQADKLARRIEGAWRIHLDKTQVFNRSQMVSLLGQFMEFVRMEAGGVVASRIQSKLVALLSVAHREQIEGHKGENGDEEE